MAGFRNFYAYHTTMLVDSFSIYHAKVASALKRPAIDMLRFTAGLHLPKTEDENAFQEAKRKDGEKSWGDCGFLSRMLSILVKDIDFQRVVQTESWVTIAVCLPS